MQNNNKLKPQKYGQTNANRCKFLKRFYCGIRLYIHSILNCGKSTADNKKTHKIYMIQFIFQGFFYIISLFLLFIDDKKSDHACFVYGMIIIMHHSHSEAMLI